MEAQELHRGRLIDHIHLVVRDLGASKSFYEAVCEALNVPMGGDGDGFFWADELFVSTADSPAAQGKLTGRCHLAFQAKDRAMVDAFYKLRWHTAAGTMAPPESAPIIRTITQPSYSIRTATTSKPYTMARQREVPFRFASRSDQKVAAESVKD